MKNLSPVNDDKDIISKDYADSKYLSKAGGAVEAAFGGSMANFKGFEVKRTGLTQDYTAYMKFSTNLKDNGFIGMNGSGNFRIVKINDDETTSNVMSLNDGRLTTSASGLLLYDGSVGSTSTSISIENLSEYAAIWASIDGVGTSGQSFALTTIIPIAYLVKSTSNSVKLGGGISSSAYTTSSGPLAIKGTAGTITATASDDTLSLEISDGTIGNVTLISLL